jgi:D-alanine--poly(phosphoribitol) ligase subunit 1
LIYLQTLKLITPSSFPRLTRIIFGGEGYPKPALQKLHEALGRRIALYNVYGPTECTCICSTYRITEHDFGDLNGYPPLGGLIPNFSHVIMRDDGTEAPAGETGELLLGGPCVGLGYYASPQQTAEAFVQNPTHETFFDRMYRTGDLVRVEPADGKIYFVGRADRQIKHQGYRIELGEIEHAACAIEGVDEAAAIFGPCRDGGPNQIAVALASSRPLQPMAVKEALSRRLPAYMIPERVYVVRELLKNANGKIDRNAIAAAVRSGQLRP